MKSSGHLIVYISENEDFELWKVLSQLPSDDRTAFVKFALKKALQETNSKKSNLRTNISNSSGVDVGLTDLALDGIDYDALMNNEETVIKPLLEYFVKEAKVNSRETEVDTKNDNFDEVGALNLMSLDELLQSSDSIQDSIPGLNFLLNNVIGEEDDELVIDFIKNSRS